MQSFLIMSPDSLGHGDLVRPLLKSTSNGLYHLYFNEGIEDKYDYVVFSAHDPSGFLYRKKAAILIAVVSYIPDVDSDEWPSFYTNLCLTNVVLIDRYNERILQEYHRPKNTTIFIDGSSMPTITPRRGIPAVGPYTVVNIDPGKPKLWDKYIEYYIQAKENRIKIVTDPREADIAVSLNPVGYGLAQYLSNEFSFYFTANNGEHTSILDSRNMHHLNKRLGGIIDVKGSAYVPQIKAEFKEFTDTLCTLLEHLSTTSNRLNRYHTTQTFMDRLFHQINATYKP